MGVTLENMWQVWKTQGASSFVCNVLRDGVKLTFEREPPLSPSPISFSPPIELVKRRALDMEISELKRKGVLEPVQKGEYGFYSRIFLVPKKDGSWRPIIDLSQLNAFLVIPKFSMETPETIRLATRQGDWAISIDLKDAYFHLPIRESDRKFLSFSYQGEAWRFKNLCFGLATAPWFFTKAMLEVKNMLLRQGISAHVYLDDWLIRSQDKEKLIHQKVTVLALCQELGLMVNWEKSDLTPKQDYVFLGYRFENLSHRVFPPEDRIQSILKLVHTFLSSSALSARVWASLIGLLGSVDKIIPGGRLKIRPLQIHMMSQWSQVLDPDFRQMLGVPKALKVELLWWTVTENWTRGVPTLPQNPHLTIYTDASNSGWGAHSESQKHRLWGTWSKSDKRLHINILEFKAVTLAVKTWETKCQNKIVLVATDNSTVVSYLNHRGGTRSPALNLLAVEFLSWAMNKNIQIRARHIPGQLNVLADALSRKGMVIKTEWALDQQEFNRLVAIADFQPTVDLFACHCNTKLEKFVSPIPDKRAMAVDAFSLSWVGMKAYAFPPTQILDRVVAKLLQDRPRMILVAQLPRQAEWLNKINSLGVKPVKLRLYPKLLSQSGKFHTFPSKLRLHGWML